MDDDSFNFTDDGEMMFEDDIALQENGDISKTITSTALAALPNHKYGEGDNMWAMAIVLLECILGISPSLENGANPIDVCKCIRTKNFYADFKNSNIYKNFYQDDEDFEPVDEFLEKALVQKPVEREANFKDHKHKYSICEVDREELKNELLKYCD